MTRLLVIEDRPGIAVAFQAEGLSLVRAYDDRHGLAFVRLARSGLVTVDLALPGQAGYRCVNALSGGGPDVPILAVVGCDDSIRETALSARLRPFVRRDRAVQLATIAGWPSTLGLPSREFDRLMAIVRRCGRVTMDPERRYLLTVRTSGFLVPAGATLAESGAYSDAWHATQFTIARDATLQHRAIA
jgi:CheY-like chemotaxis protein